MISLKLSYTKLYQEKSSVLHYEKKTFSNCAPDKLHLKKMQKCQNSKNIYVTIFFGIFTKKKFNPSNKKWATWKI